MEKLNILSVKLKKLIDEYNFLKEENFKLKMKVSSLSQDVQNHRDYSRENSLLKDKQKKAILKAEQILKKIDSVRVL